MMNVTFDFAGNNFVVVGASSGIGKQTTIELAESGANVLAVARNVERLENLKKINPSKIFTVSLDAINATSENWAAVLEDFKTTCGKIDGGVYSAGIWGLTPLNGFDSELAHKIFDTSFWGMVNFLQVASKKKFSNAGSSFVMMSSISGDYPSKSLFAYSSAKAAVQAAVKSFSKEIIKNRCRINSVAPAIVDTEMTGNGRSAAIAGEEMISRHLLGLGTAQDVAGMILFLLSNRAAWITGQNFFVDGGYISGSYI